MSLISFHRLLIACGIVFCLGFAAWEVRAAVQQAPASGSIGLAVAFGVLGIGLIVYLRRLNRFLGYERDGG